MACPRKANGERAKWRARCRDELSKHIKENLGFSIDPSQVRLITGPDDPYEWSYLHEKRHLFEKHLSKHTLRAYLELYNGVGKSFEAVSTNVSDHIPTNSGFSEASVSFATKIEQQEQSYKVLEQEYARVAEESGRWQKRAIDESQLRVKAEEEVAHLRTELESANVVIQDLECALENSAGIVEKFRKLNASSVCGVDEILQSLEKLKSGLSLTEKDLEFATISIASRR
ncbi:hypothetical protein K469DRAFT_669658 [Zopfia rhizophila CBS 207.26]|uniref:Uncharacterized protein n=1 Tax=Zopfia rhizophila CBS 207.26 TaxID=1314779 RepID=A0A6A6DXH8_9PEZI|nr:hypothetical protein K469DRAFT_669658 [Zopfia rhizophila CBS 207.26]